MLKKTRFTKDAKLLLAMFGYLSVSKKSKSINSSSGLSSVLLILILSTSFDTLITLPLIAYSS